MSGLTPWSSDSDSDSSSSSSSASPFKTTPDRLNPDTWSDDNESVADQSASDFRSQVESKIETTKSNVEDEIDRSSGSSGGVAETWVRDRVSDIEDMVKDTQETVEDTTNQATNTAEDVKETADRVQAGLSVLDVFRNPLNLAVPSAVSSVFDDLPMASRGRAGGRAGSGSDGSSWLGLGAVVVAVVLGVVAVLMSDSGSGGGDE